MSNWYTVEDFLDGLIPILFKLVLATLLIFAAVACIGAGIALIALVV